MAPPLITLDFETYYSTDYQLRKMTTESYVRDPRFEVIGVGVQVDGAAPVWLEAWDFEAWARRFDWSKVAVAAHHAHFDGFILAERYGLRPGWWFDTLSMGRAVLGAGHVDLDALARHFNLGEKGQELAKVKGLRRRDFTQAAWQALGVYCKNDVALTARALGVMLSRFPRPELRSIDQTIRWFTEPVFRANTEVLARALAEDRAEKARLIARLGGLEDARAALSSADRFAELLRELGEEPPTKQGKRGTIYAFAKSDPGMQELLESPRSEVRHLAEARLAVKSTIVETRVERMLGIAQRGAVPFYLKFAGAHTHRWSGGDKLNVQNFNRGGALRAAVEAPDGQVIVACDSGQIEARVLAWVAGEAVVLETFRRNDERTARFQEALAARVAARGNVVSDAEYKQITRELRAEGIAEGDFYSDIGSTFFLKKISKAETPVERQLSKNMILGLGFGMGWAKFSLELLKGMLGSDPVQFTAAEADRFKVSVDAFAQGTHGRDGPPRHELVRKMTSRVPFDALLVHCAVAHYFVTRYRETNQAIKALWRQCEEVLGLMAQEGPADVVRAPFRGGLKVVRHGLVKPSGLELRYRGLRRGSSGFSYIGGDSGHERTHIYGGLLTENIVQSLARDIVAEQARQVAALGWRTATTTHDEIVCVVPEADGERCLADMVRVMRTPPSWCAALPLNAEGGVGKNYGDAK